MKGDMNMTHGTYNVNIAGQRSNVDFCNTEVDEHVWLRGGKVPRKSIITSARDEGEY
jgi:hypothetical protein